MTMTENLANIGTKGCFCSGHDNDNNSIANCNYYICDCCKGLTRSTPTKLFNIPGQSRIFYRVGTYTRFKQSMHARLSSGSNTLSRKLTSRDETQDFAIAFLDSTAVALDVLTFYQERIANEAFLSTAQERRSILELARLIGYELRPGVAASTFLAFTLDDVTTPILSSTPGGSNISPVAPSLVSSSVLPTSFSLPPSGGGTVTPAIGTADDAEAKTIIDIGIKAQSLPLSGTEMPQVFETTEKVEARASWNSLRPLLTEHQNIDENSEVIVLKGISTQLNPGDGLLVVKKKIIISDPAATTTKTENTFFRTVSKVEVDNERQITKVTLLEKHDKSSIVFTGGNLISTEISGPNPSIKKLDTGISKIFKGNISKLDQDQKKALSSYNWTMPQVAFWAARNNLNAGEFLRILNKWIADIIAIDQRTIDSTQVFAFRVRAGIFGCNAPDYKTLPSSVVGRYPDWDSYFAKTLVIPPLPIPLPIEIPHLLPINKRRIFVIDNGNIKVSEVNYDQDTGNKGTLIYLDNVYQSIMPSSNAGDSWVVLKGPKSSAGIIICKIGEVNQENVVGFLLNTRVTGLRLYVDDENPAKPLGSQISQFSFRNITVYAKSEELELAPVQIEEPVGGYDTITLNTSEAYLKKGQLVAITGEVIDDTKNSLLKIRSEIAEISDVMPDQFARTVIKFKDNIQNKYRRDTVVINANVARATHGQTKTTVLGGGDPAQSLLSFLIKEKPLTYVSAPTESGVKSTLEVYVDNVKWHEISSLYNLEPQERGYVTRHDDDFQTRITFGDEAPNGKRPNAGSDNIRARYRIGIGIDGMVRAGQISILMDRPAGVRSVTNPHAPTGAGDPEKLEQARLNAPLSVLTLGRIVSLTDYENFARAYAGIGKAHATWVWAGEEKIVYLTVASETGTQVDTNSKLYRNLFTSITKFKDPVPKFKIGTFVLKLFNVKGRILVEDGYQFENVKAEVESMLEEKFSFNARQFGQPVTISEIISLIQRNEGVEAVSIDALYLSEESPVNGNSDAIPSNIAHWDDNQKQIVLADLVILNTLPGSAGSGIDITEIKREGSEKL